MSSIDVITSVAFVLIFCVAALAAPVANQDAMQTSKVSGKDIENQERELEDLINLAHNQGMKENVQVQKVHHSSMESHNGETVRTEKTEEKVVNAQDGSVVADVKQEVKEGTSGQGKQPEAVVETEVDIPSAGIHKTFLETEDKEDNADDSGEENDDEEEEATEGSDDDVTSEEAVDEIANGDDKEEEVDDDVEEIDDSDIPLTTEDMAQYLFITQQFEDFLPALERLVNLSKMTATDAAVYAKAVIEEYEKLNMAALRNTIDAEKRSQAFYQAQQAQVQPLVPDLAINEQMLSPSYEPYGANQANLYPEQQFFTPEQLQQLQRQAYFQENPMYQFAAQYPMNAAQFPMNSAQFPMNPAQLPVNGPQFPMNTPQSMDPLDFMAVLYDAAYGKENPEAQEIIQLLYDRVSQDDNPNDLEQIRDLLIDTVSASMYNNELPLAGQMPNEMSAFDPEAELSPRQDGLITSPDFVPEQQMIQNGNEEEAKRDDDVEESEDGGDEVAKESDEESNNTELKNDEASEKEEDSEKTLEDELSNIAGEDKTSEN